MKCTVTQRHLDRGLTIVNHAVPGKATLAIQSFILATTDGERLRLSAMKEEMGIHCWIPAEGIAEEGTTLLPAKLVTEMVSHLPSAPVVLTAPSSQDAGSCHLNCLRIHADLKNGAEQPDEFPAIASFTEGGEPLLVLDADLLKEIIGQVAFAAAQKDDKGATLLGLRIEIREGMAVFAAADSFRLAVRTIAIPDDRLRCDLLVPARTMTDLAKILPSTGTVQMVLTPNRHQLLFHLPSVDLSTRLLEGDYPTFRSVIPQTWTTRAVLRTQELAAAVRLMLPFAREGGEAIRLSFCGTDSQREQAGREANTLTLEATAQDVGTNQNVVSAVVEGPDQDITLHVTYLSEVLSVLETAEVSLEMTSPLRPLVVRPIGPADFVYVSMPLYTRQASDVSPSHAPQSADQVPVTAAR